MLRQEVLSQSIRNLKFSKREQKRLQTMRVEALILFGSQAQGLARDTSDVDIGVLLSGSLSPEKRRQLYDVLYQLLSSKMKRLVTIDIVFLDNASMDLKSHIAFCGIPLYERSPFAFVNFRERVMRETADFAPLRAVFHNAILRRIP